MNGQPQFDNTPPDPQREPLRVTVGVADMRQVIHEQSIDLAGRELGKIEQVRKKTWLGRFGEGVKNAFLHQSRKTRLELDSYDEVSRSQNFFGAGGNQVQTRETFGIIADRLLNADAQLLRQDRGESRQEVLNHPEDPELQGRIKRFIADYIQARANMGMTEEQFVGGQHATEYRLIRTRLRGLLSDGSSGFSDNEFLQADNLLETARSVYGYILAEQGNGNNTIDIDQTVDAIQIDLARGVARGELNTDVHRNAFDRLAHWTHRSRIGSWVNGAVLAPVAGIVTAGGYVARTAASSRIAQKFTLGGSAVLTGALGALTSYQQTKSQAAHYGRERAQGQEFAADDVVAQRMERVQVARQPVATLIRDLEGIEQPRRDENIEDYISRALFVIQETEMRVQIGSREQEDLIAYTSPMAKYDEYRRLCIGVARAKTRVQSLLRSTTDDRLDGFSDQQRTYEYWQQQNATLEGQHRTGLESRVRDSISAMKSMARGEALRNGAYMALFSILFGAAAQEIFSWFQGSVRGVVESIINNDSLGANEKRTMIMELYHSATGGGPANYVPPSTPVSHGADYQAPLNSAPVAPGGVPVSHGINLPDGVGANESPTSPGTYDFYKDNQLLARNIHIGYNPDGTFNANTLAELRAQGATVTTVPGHSAGFSPFEGHHSAGPGHTTGFNGNTYLDQYHQANPTQGIELDRYWDNNTHAFDGNELRLDLAGQNGSGIIRDAAGHITGFQFSIDRMLDSMSGSDTLKIKELLAHGGNLQLTFVPENDLLLTGSNHPISVSFDATGHAIIPVDSPIAQGYLGLSPDGSHVGLHTGQAFLSYDPTPGTLGSDGLHHVQSVARIESVSGVAPINPGIALPAVEAAVTVDFVRPPSPDQIPLDQWEAATLGVMSRRYLGASTERMPPAVRRSLGEQLPAMSRMLRAPGDPLPSSPDGRMTRESRIGTMEAAIVELTRANSATQQLLQQQQQQIAAMQSQLNIIAAGLQSPVAGATNGNP